MKIEFKAHPGQARHPVTDQPLRNDDGTHVPIIKDQHAVFLDGFMVGYTKIDGSWLMTTIFLQPPVIDAIKLAMAEKYGHTPEKVRQTVEAEEAIPEEPASNDEEHNS